MLITELLQRRRQVCQRKETKRKEGKKGRMKKEHVRSKYWRVDPSGCTYYTRLLQNIPGERPNNTLLHPHSCCCCRIRGSCLELKCKTATIRKSSKKIISLIVCGVESAFCDQVGCRFCYPCKITLDQKRITKFYKAPCTPSAKSMVAQGQKRTSIPLVHTSVVVFCVPFWYL